MKLIVKNGTVASSKEVKKADIYINDEKIEAVAGFYTKIPDGYEDATVIDASEKLVMPGGVDVHTHLDMPFMGTFSTDDFETGTIAAAYGGTTSLIDYIIPEKGKSLKDAFEVWQEKSRNKAVIDYGFHMAIVPPVDNILSELKELKSMGITSIKFFMAYKNVLMLNDSEIFALFKAAKEQDILVCVHAENGEIIDYLTKEFLKEGKTEPIWHAKSRPPQLEGESVSRILKLANIIDIPVYFVHLSTRDALKEIKRARKQNQKVYTETCPQYILLSEEKYLEENFGGAKFVMSPPLREDIHKKSLLKAILKRDAIDVIATDHCPFNFEIEKQMGRNDFTKIPNGMPGIETRMPLLYQKLVVEELLPLNKFVEITCTKPAKIFQLKNKGDIEPGMDADIVIWDPDINWTVNAENLHQNCDYTPFENYKVKGKPETILSRGNIIIENGELKAKPGQGNYLKRL